MLNLGSRKTLLTTSLFYPMSAGGLVTLVLITGFFGLLRFMGWLLEKNVMSISTASVIIFVVVMGAYAARCLVLAAEMTAEGCDEPPSPPNPREIEHLLPAALSLLVVLFFGILPYGILSMIGIDLPPVVWASLGFMAFYFPMGMLGAAIVGDLTGAFPVRVLGAAFATIHRYLPSTLFAAAAGGLIYASWTVFHDLPMPILLLMDLGACWLLLSLMHRMGVLHREEPLLQSLIPLPVVDNAPPAAARQVLPQTEIEKIMAQRERERSQGTPLR